MEGIIKIALTTQLNAPVTNLVQSPQLARRDNKLSRIIDHALTLKATSNTPRFDLRITFIPIPLKLLNLIPRKVGKARRTTLA